MRDDLWMMGGNLGGGENEFQMMDSGMGDVSRGGGEDGGGGISSEL